MPIRVLQVVSYMQRGGLETMLMNYYRHIDRDNVQFDFLVHRDFEADYDSEILNLGGKIHHMPYLNPFGYKYLHELDEFYKQHPEYLIVHSHLDCLAGIPLKIAKKNHVPVRIAHAHSSNQTRNIKYPIKLLLKNTILSNATNLFACSEAAGDWMFKGTPFSVISNAIDAKQYCFNPQLRAGLRAEFGISPQDYVIGHVGRFMPEKNHLFLLDIFAEVARKRPNCFLMLVGGGKMETELRKKAASLQIENRIVFTGVRDDVPNLLQAMDVFVMPSLYEGLGIACIEAQASGLPCVVSDRVPAECKKVKGQVTQVGLKEPLSVWVNAILRSEKRVRKNTMQEIVESGFDIQRNAKWLENFYLQQYEMAKG